jgi:hypothetical protein
MGETLRPVGTPFAPLYLPEAKAGICQGLRWLSIGASRSAGVIFRASTT